MRYPMKAFLFVSMISFLTGTAQAQAPSEPPAVVSTPASDRQRLEDDLRKLEEEVERVRRTQGEPGIQRRGLKQKLEAKREYTEFHVRLLARFERIERRLDALESRTGARQ